MCRIGLNGPKTARQARRDDPAVIDRNDAHLSLADPSYHFAQPWWDAEPARPEVDLTSVPAAQPELVIRAERV